MATNQISWIAADWGTTNLRIWLMSASNDIMAHRQSDKGMGKLKPAEFEAALLDLLDDCLTPDAETPVVICGMAGSRQGWVEAPYITTPCTPPGLADATHVTGTDRRITVSILPGVKQIDPADVMRGEETQIAGFLASEPSFTGIICLPGTHTKWVHVSNGTIASFSTFMSGELFDLLSRQSVLRHGVQQSEINTEAFSSAIMDIKKAPQNFAAELFGIRAKGLIAGLTPSAAFSRLSGLVIGAELSALDLTAAPDGNVIILGADRLADAYATGLQALGLSSRKTSVETATLHGLILAHSQLKETET
ncbi:2-dehydro-3-deoxygalactonokinase [Roseibium algae]|uniref:2-dehydro-3-deoxygalactonokinase n=1 Tax=Roseibium algae TaxID=3123038 RepID=A0ABU8TG34_9HYPH